MTFWDSIMFWLAKAFIDFLIGVGIVVIFMLIFLWVEINASKRKAKDEQRKTSEAIYTKGKESR